MKRKNLTLIAGLGLANLLLPSGNVLAQENPARTLDDVLVTASRSPKKRSESGKVVRIIPAEILAKSQGKTLPEVLNQVAGLTIGGNANNPGDVKAVYLRGAAPGNTLILLDGLPLNDASGISGQFDISAISIEQVERIEIVKGGNSTLYGSDAVAGVINIITKKGSSQLSASVLASAGSYDTYKAAIGLNGQMGNTSLAFNASGLDSKSFSVALPSGNEQGLERDPFNQKSAGLTLDHQLTKQFVVKGIIQANKMKGGLDYGAFADAKNYTFDKTAIFTAIGGNYKAEKLDLNFNLSRNSVKNIFNDNNSLTNNLGRINHAEATLNFEAFNFLELISGGTYKWSDTKQVNPFSPLLSADNNIGSVFTSLFFKSSSGFYAEIGGRYNRHSEYGNNFTYTFNPSYVIKGRYKLFANISSAYKVPSLYQLFSEYGNLGLKPERSKTYEAGFDLDLLPEKLNLNFSWFRRKIKDVIDFGPLPNDAYGYINRSSQDDKGFEMEAGFKLVSGMNLTAYYAYVDGKQTSPGEPVFNLFRRPKNSFGASADLELGKKMVFNLNYKYTGQRSDRYYDSGFNLVDQNLRAYHLLDLYLQYKPKSALTLFTDVKNVLDQDYTEFAGFSTKGINFNSGVKIEFR